MKIIAIGKTRNKNLINLNNFFLKQMKNLKIEIISKSNKFDENVKIMKKIKQRDYVIALDSQGESIDSIKFSNLINSSETYINKEIVFVIGGSEGLDKNIIARADKVLSFSKLTFQHQIVRLLLIEQIYRAKKIQENHPYHK
jgi:rRNA large subunit m3Psi methyltransferase RlmH